MSSSDARWAVLASQHERVVQDGESRCDSADRASTATRAHWDELASQRERLAADSDLLFRLASSRHHVAGLHVVEGAA